MIKRPTDVRGEDRISGDWRYMLWTADNINFDAFPTNLRPALVTTGAMHVAYVTGSDIDGAIMRWGEYGYSAERQFASIEDAKRFAYNEQYIAFMIYLRDEDKWNRVITDRMQRAWQTRKEC